jgi:predicted secreted protein
MKTRLKLLIILSLALASGLYAGDKAEFVNLGFSPDGRYFLFGQYGYSSEITKSYADIYLVDVEKNLFVSGGVFNGEYVNVLEPGQSSDGALFTLLESALSAKNKYHVSFLEKGRPLYIRIEESEESMDTLDFRDFETGSHYKMNLHQDVKVDDKGMPFDSSFYIDLSYTSSSGSTVPFSIGHPDYRRKGIGEYRIERVITDPKGRSIIIVLAKIDKDLNVRYMVETLGIR